MARRKHIHNLYVIIEGLYLSRVAKRRLVNYNRNTFLFDTTSIVVDVETI